MASWIGHSCCGESATHQPFVTCPTDIGTNPAQPRHRGSGRYYLDGVFVKSDESKGSRFHGQIGELSCQSAADRSARPRRYMMFTYQYQPKRVRAYSVEVSLIRPQSSISLSRSRTSGEAASGCRRALVAYPAYGR